MSSHFQHPNPGVIDVVLSSAEPVDSVEAYNDVMSELRRLVQAGALEMDHEQSGYVVYRTKRGAGLEQIKRSQAVMSLGLLGRYLSDSGIELVSDPAITLRGEESARTIFVTFTGQEALQPLKRLEALPSKTRSDIAEAAKEIRQSPAVAGEEHSEKRGFLDRIIHDAMCVPTEEEISDYRYELEIEEVFRVGFQFVEQALDGGGSV